MFKNNNTQTIFVYILLFTKNAFLVIYKVFQKVLSLKESLQT